MRSFSKLSMRIARGNAIRCVQEVLSFRKRKFSRIWNSVFDEVFVLCFPEIYFVAAFGYIAALILLLLSK